MYTKFPDVFLHLCLCFYCCRRWGILCLWENWRCSGKRSANTFHFIYHSFVCIPEARQRFICLNSVRNTHINHSLLTTQRRAAQHLINTNKWQAEKHLSFWLFSLPLFLSLWPRACNTLGLFGFGVRAANKWFRWLLLADAPFGVCFMSWLKRSSSSLLSSTNILAAGPMLVFNQFPTWSFAI